MKKTWALLFCIIIAMTMCSCGKIAIPQTEEPTEATEETQTKPETVVQVESLISEIGEVSIGSRDAINKAIDLWDSLSEEEQALVENAEELTDKRKAFNEIINSNYEKVVSGIVKNGNAQYDGLDISFYSDGSISAFPANNGEFGVGSSIAYYDVDYSFMKDYKIWSNGKTYEYYHRTVIYLSIDNVKDSLYFTWSYDASTSILENYKTQAEAGYMINLSDYRNGSKLPSKIYNNMTNTFVSSAGYNSVADLRADIDKAYASAINALEAYIKKYSVSSLEGLAGLGAKALFDWSLDENGNPVNSGTLLQQFK